MTPDSEEKEEVLQSEHADAPLPAGDGHGITRCPLGELPSGVTVGASLLCYAVDPMYSRVYFLLGRERTNAQWRAGSERWSDFGGRTLPDTTSAEDTAAREFVEETMGMVKFFPHDTLPRQGWTDIADALRASDYTFKLTFGANGGGPVSNYVTFVRQLTWDPAAIGRFESCRHRLRLCEQGVSSPKMHPAVQWAPTRGVHVLPDFMEKNALGLWSIPQLQNAVEHYGILVRRNGRVERCRRNFMNTLELVLSEFAFLYPEAMGER
jgi:hypothetical protein